MAKIIETLGISSAFIVFVQLATKTPIKQIKYPQSHHHALYAIERSHHKEIWVIFHIKRNTENDGLAPIQQIWVRWKNELDSSIVHSMLPLWFALQQEWDNISVDVPRIYWHHVRDISCYNCCKRWANQVSKLKVHNSRALFIQYFFCTQSNYLHVLWSWFRDKKVHILKFVYNS